MTVGEKRLTSAERYFLSLLSKKYFPLDTSFPHQTEGGENLEKNLKLINDCHRIKLLTIPFPAMIFAPFTINLQLSIQSIYGSKLFKCLWVSGQKFRMFPQYFRPFSCFFLCVAVLFMFQLRQIIPLIRFISDWRFALFTLPCFFCVDC